MNNECYQRVIENIRVEIKKSGLKQSAIAARIGMTPAQFNHVMHYRKRLEIGVIPSICGILGIDISRVFEARQRPAE